MTANNDYYGESITFGPDDVHIILISAMRYTFGRQTYMPHAIVKVIKTKWSGLSNATKYVILQDVHREINDYARMLNIYNAREEKDGYYKPMSLGASCDIEMWYSFYEWLKEQNIEGKENIIKNGVD